jgi:phage shock protein PspC (stress-responsive transcriptional regulator)
MEDKRFYRSNQHRILGGVCGGLGDYFDIDPVIMRIIFFILAFAGGGGVLIYIILWILVPEEPVLYSKKTQTPPNNHSQHSSNPFNTENMNAENVHFEEMGNDRFIPNINFGDLWPLILVAIGVILIYENYKDKPVKK